MRRAVLVVLVACNTPPPVLYAEDPPSTVTILPPEASSPETSRAKGVACRVPAPDIDPTRAYCFVYRERTPAVWERFCTDHGGKAIAGHCPSAGHVGTCLTDDGTERWSYAPATPAMAREQCDRMSVIGPPATFHAPGDEVSVLHVSEHACIMRNGTCDVSRYRTAAGLEDARERCVGVGSNAERCPSAQRLGWCYLLLPGMDTAYYAPTYDRDSAADSCEQLGAGVFVPDR